MIPLHAGETFADRFEIDRLAGAGGMGTVYRARDRSSGEVVALKILHAAGSDSFEAERSRREAQLLSELRHPSIVRYVAHGQTPDGCRFLAMEWLAGEDLACRLARGPLTLSESLRLINHVASALAMAHERGIVHRDVKPTNLFLPGGDIANVKLLDFGIARRMATSQAMTRTGAVIGTPEYMAPEQVRGVRDLGPAADVFSLGCVLYECLVGHPPFVAEHIAAVLVRILFEDPIPVAMHRADVPKSVASMLTQMLSKDAGSRPANAQAVCSLLGEIGAVADTPPQFLGPADRSASLFAGSERALFSVVVASIPALTGPDQTTLEFHAAHIEQARRESLYNLLRSLGARAEYLLDGTLIVTFHGAESATDLAVRAARCAIIIKEKWAEVELAIATGRGSVQENLPVGEAVDRAARLLSSHRSPGRTSAAAKNQSEDQRPAGIWLDELSAQLLDRTFSIRQQPDGFLLMSEQEVVDQARPLLGKPTPCVGRDQELSILDAVLAHTIEESESRIILITAPPGGGKSRLRREFLRRVASRDLAATVLFGRGDMMSAGGPYSLLRDALHRLCGIAGSEALDEQRQLLKVRISRNIRPDRSQRIVEFLGELCAVPFPDQDNPQLQCARHEPKVMSDLITEAFTQFLQAETDQQPLVLVLEDLHWGDSLTVKLLDSVLRKLSDKPLLMIALARPEVHELFPKLWHGHMPKEVPLGALGKRASERLIQQIIGKQIPAEMVIRIVEQSSGNPLFLEELIRAYATGKTEELPATVLAMLQARLGRLEPKQRRILLAASVFGDTFWSGGLHALRRGEQSMLEQEEELQHLIAAELIEQRRESRFRSEVEYGFRQSLLREAAYSLLTDGDRQIGHFIAAGFLEAVGEPDPNILAEHYQRGGEPARAISWLVKAAEQCMAKDDLAGTLARSARGLDCGATGEQLGALYTLKGWAHVWRGELIDALPVAQQAIELLPVGSHSWCIAMAVLLGAAGILGLPELLASLTDRFLAADPDAGSIGAYVQTATTMISIFSMLGLRVPARVYFDREQAVSIRAPLDALVQRWLLYGTACNQCLAGATAWNVLVLARQATDAFERAGDVRNAVFSRGLLAEMCCELGDRVQAASILRESLEIMRRLDEGYRMVFLNIHLAWVLAGKSDESDLAEAAALADALLLSPDTMTTYRGWAHLARARIALTRGQFTLAEEQARTASRMLLAAPAILTRANGLLVAALLGQGRHPEVLPLVHESLASERSSKLKVCETELRLAQAEALYAIAEKETAHGILRDLMNQVRDQAAHIPDSEWQAKFLKIPANVRIYDLGRQWLS